MLHPAIVTVIDTISRSLAIRRLKVFLSVQNVTGTIQEDQSLSIIFVSVAMDVEVEE